MVKSLSKKAVFTSRIKRRVLKHVWLVRLFIIGLAAVSLYIILALFLVLLRGTPLQQSLSFVSNFILAPRDKILSVDGNTNILILGKAGENHDAPDLTDTIFFGSVSRDQKNISLVSLPRDIWISSLRAKLNSAYYWGNQKQAGGGLILAKSTVEEIIGQPVHYALVIDFAGFTKVIDVLGGIEVDVERDFVDEKYPIAGRERDLCGGDPEYKCRYETISFTKGTRFMDGETALKFVRSRNAQGDEGTDLARGARQQKIIAAIKNKLLSPDIFFSPRKAFAILKIAKDYTETDITPEALAIAAREIVEARNNVNSHVLPEEFLINPPISIKYDNLYVFVPEGGNWDKVHRWIDQLISR